MSTTIEYKGSTLTTVSNETKKLDTAGTWLEDDIVITDSSSGGSVLVVDTLDSHGGTIREITALDISDTTAIASDVAQGKYFYTAQGVKTQGTASGGGGATQHTIHLEFVDTTDTDIPVYYNDSLIGTMITNYAPDSWTYNNKLVYHALLDNVEWYDGSGTWETLFGPASVGWFGDETPGTYPYCWIGDTMADVETPVGSKWRVTFDGVEYILVAKIPTGATEFTNPGIGNPLWVQGSDDGTDVPFFIGYYGYGAWSGGANVPFNSSVIMKIERFVES